MVDVLLTHCNHLYSDRKQVEKMQPYPPIGTLYAAAALREKNISVAVFDPMLEEPEHGIARAIRVHRPRIVVIYEDDFNFLSKMCLTRMRDVAWSISKAAPNAMVSEGTRPQYRAARIAKAGRTRFPCARAK